jgi:hypothetical protein
MKPLFVVSCPIDTYSGYGARSRDFVKALIQLNTYDVKILPQRWGNTPWGFIDENPEWGFLTPHLLEGGNLPKKPEIWCQVTVPNEFQAVGKYNIGLTAGIETTGCHHTWIQGCNNMDLVLTSSNHSKKVFKETKFDAHDPNTKQKIGEIKLDKPIEVLIEGANLEVYKPQKSSFDLTQVKENFAFLFVGHWMHGLLGHDRKNLGHTIQIFLEAFKNKKNTPALILKTSITGGSYIDRNEIFKRINQVRDSIKDARTLPNIYLVHGDMSDDDMNKLYNHQKVKAMVSLTKGEGFGRPLLEFSLTKKPIIATNWSGHTDFLSSEFTTLLPGGLHNLDDSSVVKDMLLKETQWFAVDPQSAYTTFRDMFANYKDYKEKANRQAFRSKSEFSFNKMVEQIEGYLKNYLPEFPKPIKLKLPKIDKIKLPKAKKLENVEG